MGCAVGRASARSRGVAALAVGDFNTCRAYVDEAGKFDTLAHYMDRMRRSGFATYGGGATPTGANSRGTARRGNGFRIDHAFLSPELAARAGEIRYSHDERLAGLSDHSAMVLDLRV